MATTIPTTTASTRPSNPSTGDAYFETDTKKYIIYDGTDWRGWNNDGIAAAPLTNTYSVDIDGVDDYVDIGSIGSAGRALGCLSLWVNTDTVIQTNNTSARGVLVSWGSASTQGFTHGWLSSSDRILNYRSASANKSWWTVGANKSLSAGWHHLVLNHDGTGYTFYVDGDLASNHTLGGTITVGSESVLSGTAIDNFKIGIGNSSSFPTGGLYDEVAIWDSALTATQISEIYNSGVPISLASYSPDGWWRMGDNDGGTGTTITDQSGNGNDGTLTNGPTFSTSVPS